MKEVRYEFEELESTASFSLLGKAFKAKLQNDSLQFDHPLVKGELIKKSPEEGLWIRKWKLTVGQKIILHRLAAQAGTEEKFSIIYFLNPFIFYLKAGFKKVCLNTQRNNIFLSNQMMMDFAVVPKQPFYVVDITFTRSWLLRQFAHDDDCLENITNRYIKANNKILTDACNSTEYRLLHELDKMIQADKDDVLFLRSRIYQLIGSFFNKAFQYNSNPKQKQTIQNYELMAETEALLMQQLQKPPKVVDIARKVNMSSSSLLRQFKAMYGKSLHEYYTGKKMELARKMVMEGKMTIKKLAETLGYKQPSHFIATFTKHFGYSPGSLKNYPLFP